MTITA